MRTFLGLTLLCAMGGTAVAQSPKPQSFRMRCDYFYSDTKGAVGRRERVSAVYTRDLPQARIRWTNVAIAEANGPAAEFGPSAKRDFMEGFSYTRADVARMLAPEFFTGFPPAATQERNLVWDTHMLEDFAAGRTQPGASEVALAGAGTFKHKDLQVTRTGTTKRTGEECAVIDYRAFHNAIEMKLPGMSLIARSHYWGQVWVSIATKRIEYATLLEDVLGELTLQGQAKPQIISVFRTGVLEPAGNYP